MNSRRWDFVFWWTGVLGPPVVWSVHLVICYVAVSIYGARGTGLMTVLGIITLAAAILLVLLSRLARREDGPRQGLPIFFSRFANWSAGIFLVGIALTAAPIYALGIGR